MEHKKRRILCVGVVALLLLSIVATGVAVSQPVQKGNAMGKVAPQGLTPEGVTGATSTNQAIRAAPIRVVHSGHGFALNGDEFHVLRVHIVRAKRIRPIHVRGLMGENKSIEELRAEIEGAGGRPIYRGHLRLGENHYLLGNVSVDRVGDNRIVNADIVERGENGAIVGKISVTTMDYEGVKIGDGELAMYEGEYSGEYRALLDVLPPRWRPIPRRETR
jgi:hypothetical protein